MRYDMIWTSSLTILQNSAERLFAEQSPPGGLFFMVIAMLIAATLSVVMLRFRKWVLGAFMAVMAAGFSLALLPAAAYRVSVDRQARTVSWDRVRSGKVEAHQELAAAEIQSADFDFNRNARNILLIGRDGRQYLPLGDQHFSGEPEQSIVLAAIREVIAQAVIGPATPLQRP